MVAQASLQSKGKANRTQSPGHTAGGSLTSRSFEIQVVDAPRSRLSSRLEASGALDVIDDKPVRSTPLINMIPTLVSRYEDISHIAALRLARLEREDLIAWARSDDPRPLRPDTTPDTSLTFGEACWRLIHSCMV